MFDYIAIIPFLPALGALINGILGTRFPKSLVHIIALTAIGSAFAISLKAFFHLLSMPPDQRIYEVTLYKWMASGDFSIDVAFLLDPLSAVMLLVVTGVGFLIHIYSTGYMHDDPSYSRFFTYLNLFVFAMLLLVMGNNFLMMFVGWEGVGLCSYLLIGFWFEDHNNANAGKKAFVVNRVGDFGFILGMLLIFVVFGTLKYSEVFSKAQSLLPYGGTIATAITLLLFVGATGKSAQIPLYVWLPDAMAGPTPVSALIHAATMVTAGVYMIARCNVLYSLAPFSLGVVATIGALTALFAATMGLLQRDIKKVLAYSTISQLGYMFLGVGVASYSAGVFHLMTHAFFKALLFLGAGSVIHAMGGEQDIMNMGGLRKHIPKTFITFLIGTLAIAGTPGLAGFFSKDEILWQAFSSPHGHPILWAIGAVAAGMTSFYMFRLTFLTFFGKERMDEHTKHHIHESPNSMVIPLMILALLSVVGGYVGVPPALGGSNHF
ncbi:MAG: NADH-quinone oxidoreductase subunit L, partial [candidate division WOR-3 bacterium]